MRNKERNYSRKVSLANLTLALHIICVRLSLRYTWWRATRYTAVHNVQYRSVFLYCTYFLS
ncbi:Hypothetical protein CKL_0606 [Clostridium kluyveri DSM 555]|uniref:Uncharacterized protein n=1 Tax=Clostridium kluyveri (strain ATCC 8527 / DSM 555 / NBRC 12016 / NCIMB 10680 / K1) TaxID=431943 RepID=A5N5S9_CLOK5|nr:Hypothetical protein CKL_0606 [Clostridium kluyveri DSM 555]